VSADMRADPTERPVPFTADRAVTELVQSEREVDRARDSLELAIEIVGALGGDLDSTLVAALDQVVNRVEEARAALADALARWPTWPPGTRYESDAWATALE
jgi:hypothetical protein